MAICNGLLPREVVPAKIACLTFSTKRNILCHLVAGTFAAGDTVLAKLRIFGQDTSVAYLAGIRIQYNGD